MKNKIKNILKYILTYTILAILGGLLFFTNLFANVQATTNNNLNNYKVGTTQNLYDEFISNDVEIANQNTQQYVTGNSFCYTIFNIQNYKNSMSYINDYVLTIPYKLLVTIPQNNNYEFNNYSVALYYFYTNDYSNITINNFNTFIESVTNDLNKETNTDNYYNDYINFTIPQNNNYTYIVFGYYFNIDYDTTTTPTYSWVELTFGFEYSLINVFSGTNETNESLKQQNQQLQNDLTTKNNEYNSLYEDYTTMQTDLNYVTNNYSNLQQNYNHLQQQYNDLATNEYTFENLFWSVGSVPMAFLMQSFNVNVLGINIRAIITGLITAIIVIWIIKKIIR